MTEHHPLNLVRIVTEEQVVKLTPEAELVVRLSELGAQGPRGEPGPPGRDGMDGTAGVPEVLDGGNF